MRLDKRGRAVRGDALASTAVLAIHSSLAMAAPPATTLDVTNIGQ